MLGHYSLEESSDQTTPNLHICTYKSFRALFAEGIMTAAANDTPAAMSISSTQILVSKPILALKGRFCG